MVKRKCKKPKFDVIVCCQGQPFHYYHSTLIGALVEYGHQYLRKRKYETMNFSLNQVLFIKDVESDEKLSWLGKSCKDCGNEKCKKLGTLPKGHDCALWQPKIENYSIKMVTNAKDAENYPISEDVSKIIEEINKLIFKNGQEESEKEK